MYIYSHRAFGCCHCVRLLALFAVVDVVAAASVAVTMSASGGATTVVVDVDKAAGGVGMLMDVVASI